MSDPGRIVGTLSLIALLLLGGCVGPSNPEPILMNPDGIDLSPYVGPDLIAVWADAGSVSGADQVLVVDLDELTWEKAPVQGDGSFHLDILGQIEDRFRISALAGTRWVSVTIRVVPDPHEVVVIPEADQGCLRVEPTHLQLGEATVGSQSAGEVLVSNGCSETALFDNVTSTGVDFTATSDLPTHGLLPDQQAVIDITFAPSEAGEQIALLSVEPQTLPSGQVPLVVSLEGLGGAP